MPLIDLSPGDIAIVQHVLRRFVPDRDVVAFGSRAKWTAKGGSDLDLAVLGETPVPTATMAAMKDAFDESSLPFNVDVIDWATTKDAFRRIIRRDQVLLKAAGPAPATDDWWEVPLGDLAEIFDGPHATPQKTEAGPVFLGISNLVNGRLDLRTVEHLSQEDHARWTRRVAPRAGDVVFSYETRLGEAARIPEGLECCLGRRMGLLRAKVGLVDPRFLLYAFLGPDFQETIRSRTIHGSTVDRIPLVDLPQFPIRVAKSLTEQHAIAHILGALDDKIELNRRMNETLEAMARALFKSWFVDFDPVRAKAEGRDPGLPQVLADLFPDSFQDSELGEIPKGWEAQALSDCVDVARGLSYKGSGLSEGGVPMHNLNSIHEGGGYKREGLKRYDGDYKSQHLARAGDLIVANTEQGHDRLLIGYAAIVPSRFRSETIFSHHIYRVRPKTDSALTADYLCQLLNTRVMHDIVSGYANGTTVNMLAVDGLQSPLMVVPPARAIAAFGGLASAARMRHDEMTEESRTLADLRDALLPKLISGELRVTNVEQFIERTGS